MITNENYYSGEANVDYMSVSQFKQFKDCEESAMAQIWGLYQRPTTDAMRIGSYVDAHFSGEMGQFTSRHPELFNSRTGELKAAYRAADKMIARAEADPFFMSFMDGDTQTILTGEIAGVPIKGKLDVLQSDKIVDLKTVKDLKPVRKDGELTTFIDAFGYDLQAYVYQELVRQATGEKLPYYIAAITKEPVPDLAIIQIPEWKIASAGAEMRHYLPRYQGIKDGKIEPTRCGHCDYCKATKVLTGVTPYEELLERK